MVKILADTINQLGYDAYRIIITSSEVNIYKKRNNSAVDLIRHIEYNQYNYPNLEAYQVTALKLHLPTELKLSYKTYNNVGDLVLAEADPRIKTSW